MNLGGRRGKLRRKKRFLIRWQKARMPWHPCFLLKGVMKNHAPLKKFLSPERHIFRRGHPDGCRKHPFRDILPCKKPSSCQGFSPKSWHAECSCRTKCFVLPPLFLPASGRKERGSFFIQSKIQILQAVRASMLMHPEQLFVLGQKPF